MAKGYMIASMEGISEYYLNSEYHGSTLSKRLYKDSIAAQKATTNTVRAHLKSKTSWQKLTVDIKAKTVPVGDIPQYLKDVESALKKYGADSKELNGALKTANKRIAKFSDKNGITRTRLKKSYSDVVKAAQKGDTALLTKKMKSAVNTKAIVNSERTAKTELSRAYFDSEVRAIQDDSDMVGIRWQLSYLHPRADICDYYAEQDDYGMGKGVCPTGKGYSVPAHPRCFCTVEGVLREDVKGLGKYKKPANSSEITGFKEPKKYDTFPAELIEPI